jgi:hypothetical protein
MKVYGASRASLPARPAMWKDLRARGAKLTSTWIDEAGENETDDFAQLWVRIQLEVAACDRLVLYVEPEDFPLKGALVEVGMALALNIPVWVVAPGVKLNKRDLKPMGSWAMHPLVLFCSDIEMAVGLKPDALDLCGS